MASPSETSESPERPISRWLPAALLCGAVYSAVGIGFAFLDRSGIPAVPHFWRFAAWVVSAVVFAAHTIREAQRPTATSFRAALHVAIAAALGAFLLAVWILVHSRVRGAPINPYAILALVVFPLVTGIPAYAVALAATTFLGRARGPR